MTHSGNQTMVPLWALLLSLAFITGCSTMSTAEPVNAIKDSIPDDLTRMPQDISPELEPNDDATSSTALEPRATDRRDLRAQPPITRTRQTGSIENALLTELSGLSVSRATPGVLFAINDGGHAATLFALSETGEHLGSWSVAAKNRDWEDLAGTRIGGRPYLVIADTGNNRLLEVESRLIFLPEPSLDTPAVETLVPDFEVAFIYADGPKNVEALAIDGRTALLISKEPVTPSGPAKSHLYGLKLPVNASESKLQVAKKLATLPMLGDSFESRVVAAATGIDLNHPTALDLDPATNTAYLLTYRNVLEFKKAATATWAQAFSDKFNHIHSHRLSQAEALAVSPGRAIWITSENPSPPLWAIPVTPPS